MYQMRCIFGFLMLAVYPLLVCSVSPEQAPRIRADVYGDPLPEGATARLGSVRLRHAGVSWLAFLPPGNRLVSAGGNAIRIWDLNTGRQIRRLGKDHIYRFELSPDGELLATASGDCWHVWSMTPGAERVLLAKESQRIVDAIAFSHDGRHLLLADAEGNVGVWDIRQDKRVRSLKVKLDNLRVAKMAVSPDGKSLALGDAMTVVQLWDLEHWKVAWNKKVLDGISRLVFSADSRTLFAGSELHMIRSWDRDTGKETTLPRPDKNDLGVMMALSPDYRIAACANWENQICLWDLVRQRALCRVATARSECMSFAPDGKSLAVGGEDSVIRLLNVATGQERRLGAPHLDAVWFTAFLPDSQSLAVLSSSRIGLYDARTGRELSVFDIFGVHFGCGMVTSSKQLLTERADGVVCLCDLGTGPVARCTAADAGLGEAIMKTPFVGSADAEKDRRLAWALTPDQRFYAEGRLDGKSRGQTIAIRDHRTGKDVRLVWGADGRTLTVLAFSPDERRLVGVATDPINGSMVRTWDVATGRQLWQKRLQPSEYRPVAWSADSRFLALVEWGEPIDWKRKKEYVSVCNATTGKELYRCPGQGDSVHAFAFAPDGHTLATGGEGPFIFLWETASGKERRRLKGDQGTVRRLEFAPDNRLLVSVDSLSTALIWDVRPQVIDAAPAIAVAVGREVFDDPDIAPHSQWGKPARARLATAAK